MDESALRVAIIGATGFGGGELVRLLERHPGVRIAALSARGRDDERKADDRAGADSHHAMVTDQP